MNTDTGRFYRGEEAIRDAENRGEPLIYSDQRRVVPAGQNHAEIVQQIERRTQISETRQFLTVGKRMKFKR